MKPVRAGVGWQYALADLSLILFMVCAAALARHKPPIPPAQAAVSPSAATAAAMDASAPAMAEPVALWRAAPGGPTLGQWLAAQTLDPRLRLTIVARYADGRARDAFIRAEAVREGAGTVIPAARIPANRILVEPGPDNDISATLSWDVGG